MTNNTKEFGSTKTSSTASGDKRAEQVLRDVMTGLAEFYSQRRSEEIRKGQLLRAKHGLPAGRLPVGYRAVTRIIDGRTFHQVAPDLRSARHVRWAFEAFANSDETAASIGRELATHGLGRRERATGLLSPWGPAQIKTMLRNPFYLGRITFHGDQYPGGHTALVSEEIFERVQERLEPASAARVGAA